MKKVSFENNLSDKDNPGKLSLKSRKENYKLKSIKVVSLEIDSTVAPWPRSGVVRVVLISDTHNSHRKLNMPPGDILIHAGDFTNRGALTEIQEFDAWLGELPYQHKIVVPGNQDTAMDPAMWDLNKDPATDLATNDEKNPAHFNQNGLIKNAKVLINESVVMKGITIFGSPYTLDPFGLDWWSYKANNESVLEAMMTMPTHGVDIVVTHSPPHGVGDLTVNETSAGSKAILRKVLATNPTLHVFGQIHEAAGAYVSDKGSSQGKITTTFVNASSMSWTLKPVGPVVVDISEETKDVLNVSRGLQ